MKDRRLDAEKLNKAAAAPSNPPLKERELLLAVGKNPYEKALLLTQMAPFQSEPHRRDALLAEAADSLVRAQASEDALFAGARPFDAPAAAPPSPTGNAASVSASPQATGTLATASSGAMQQQQQQQHRQSVPLQPKVLQRTPTSCTVVHFPFNLKGNKRPAKYCLYAKSYGAGVGLTINKTAMEYPGESETAARTGGLSDS